MYSPFFSTLNNYQNNIRLIECRLIMAVQLILYRLELTN